MKLCRKCGRMLRSIYFSKNISKPDGLQSWCKNCEGKYRREKRRKVPHKIEGTQPIIFPTDEDLLERIRTLERITSEELINELRRRGFTGELNHTRTIRL